MTELAKELGQRGYTLRSGAAVGADSAFEVGATKKEIFKGFDSTGNIEKLVAHEIHPNLKGAMKASGEKAKKAGKDPVRSEWAVENLMARNTNQIFGKNLNVPVDFVIAYDSSGWTGEGARPEKGGTNQAIDMAARKGIPVINMANANWKIKLDEILNTNKEEQQASVTDIGQYVIYGNEKFIVLKQNDNGTINIYNPTLEGVASKKSVSARNLTLTDGKARIVNYIDKKGKSSRYLITPRNTIISISGEKYKKMNWIEGDGLRNAILALPSEQSNDWNALNTVVKQALQGAPFNFTSEQWGMLSPSEKETLIEQCL
jgi:hypothetical protein